MKKNIKGVTTVVWVIIIIVAVVVGSIVLYTLGSPSAPQAQSPVTVYIDDVEQTGNYTTAREIDWGAVTAGNTYTKNFTVVNNQAQPLTLKLYTAEPTGTTQSWAKNLTAITPAETLKSTLVLTLSDAPSAGTYTWRLLAVNTTAPQPTPTPSASPTPSPEPTPTPTPEPLSLECTVDAGNGVLNVTVTNNAGQTITKLAGELPFTFPFTQGDTLTFKANNATGRIFENWVFNDGTWDNTNPLKLTDIQGNFTLTAEFR